MTESAILDTAWSLLASKPLSQITIEDLAHGAGISRPTFYFYFGSKEEMVHALADRVADEIRETASAFFQPSTGSGPPDLRAGVAAYLARWREKGAVLRAMAPLAEVDDALRAFWDEVSDELLGEAAKGVDEERRAGRMLPAPPRSEDLVRALFGMLWRAGYELSLRPRSPHDENRLADTLATIIMRALYGAAY